MQVRHSRHESQPTRLRKPHSVDGHQETRPQSAYGSEVEKNGLARNP